MVRVNIKDKIQTGKNIYNINDSELTILINNVLLPIRKRKEILQ